jgi:hypothetical protein
MSAVLLVCGYVALVASQIYGKAIITSLHGEARMLELEAADASSPLPFADGSPRDFDAFCAFYESHHWHPVSNALHTCGCIGVVLLSVSSVQSIATKNLARAAQLLLWVPVVYYSLNWAGHFFVQ